MKLSIEEIKELVRLLGESDLAELHLESGSYKLRLRKPTAFAGTLPVAAPLAVPSAPLASAAPAPAAAAPRKEEAPIAEPAAEEGQVVITSPMVGTFYRASSPDAEPFVKPGDHIEVGQPICIIEAMKLFNEIESEVRGRIVKILVENGQPVEYGQPLFVVQPDAPAAGV